MIIICNDYYMIIKFLIFCMYMMYVICVFHYVFLCSVL